MAEARILYVATANGLIQLANPGKSDRWRQVGQALGGQDLRAVVTSPRDPLLAYVAAREGVIRSANGGFTWDVVYAEPVRALALDEHGVLYVGTERGPVLSSADGSTWHEADAFTSPVVQFAVAGDDTLLSVGADGSVCHFSGAGWVRREIQVPHVRGLVASPTDPRTLFVVNQTSLVTSFGTHRLPSPPTGALLVLAGGPVVLLIGTQGLLLRSDDGGHTVAAVAGPENVTILVTPPRFVDQAFAGTATGSLWFSSDRGRTWAQLRTGDAPIRSVAFARAL